MNEREVAFLVQTDLEKSIDHEADLRMRVHAMVKHGWRTADYNGWTNWETWHTKLMIDYEQETLNTALEYVQNGSLPLFEEWAITRIIGPYNNERIEEAREWNDVPYHDRLNPSLEELRDKTEEGYNFVNDINDIFGHDPVKDINPQLIDPNLVDWDEIWRVLETELDDYKQGATSEDTEPMGLEVGFLKDPHDTLYPCAWEGEKMRLDAKNAMKAHVLNAIEEEYQKPDQFIYFTVYGSGASYNWDEAGDFDIQMWVDMEKFNTLHEDQHDKSQDDLIADLRRIVQQINFPSFADLGLATEDCAGDMLIQFYPKPGTGAASENLAQKPYACYDMETDEWLVRPKPITPQFYGEAFLLVQPKCEDIAIQAEAAIDELQRHTVNWQFWYSIWRKYKNPKYKEEFSQARIKAEEFREAVKVLFEGVFGGRQEAYSEEGKGIEDERDIIQKYLEVWGIFQKLKHYARAPLPWEEQELPQAEDQHSDQDANQGANEPTDRESRSEHDHACGWHYTAKKEVPHVVGDIHLPTLPSVIGAPSPEAVTKQDVTNGWAKEEKADPDSNNTTKSHDRPGDDHHHGPQGDVGDTFKQMLSHGQSLSGWARVVKSFDDERSRLQQFFEDASRGERYQPQQGLDLSLSDPEHQRFLEEYQNHSGNFDTHIETSIPGFRQNMADKGNALVKTFGGGANLLDIGSSEGSFGKSLSNLTNGSLQTTSLDPNPAMTQFFNQKSQVPGAEHVPEAFFEGFEDNYGQEIPPFSPEHTYDVVHETMGFQFMGPNRVQHIAEAKRLLSPGGLFLTEQKLTNDPHIEQTHEQAKDQWKRQFYSDQDLAQKNDQVGFQMKQDEQKAVGMRANMVHQKDLEGILKQYFKHVAQYWSSGNFKGYAASDNPATLQRFLGEMKYPQNGFEAESIPRHVGQHVSKFAKWEDVMEHARRTRDAGGVQIANKMQDPDTGQVHVIGYIASESNPGEQHETEIWQDDVQNHPEAISLWTCDCPWGQKSWGRTRQWKKYEGRPCAHALALYWESQTTPVMNAEGQPGAQQTMPETMLPQTTAPGTPPPGQSFEQFITQPGATPGGPNLTGLPTPVEQPTPVTQQQPPAFSEPTAPSNKNEQLQISFPGALSRVARTVDFTLRQLQPGEEYFEYDGTPDVAGMSSTVYNLYDREKLVGSIDFMPNYRGSETYIFSIYVDPEYRDTNAFLTLIKPALATGQPLGGFPINPKLLDVWRRYKERNSGWRHVNSKFQNGDLVRCSIGVEGIDRDGERRIVPRNSVGEVLWSDANETIVTFPLLQSGPLEPHQVRVEAPTSAFYLKRKK